jgi:hypothetical protein
MSFTRKAHAILHSFRQSLRFNRPEICLFFKFCEIISLINFGAGRIHQGDFSQADSLNAMAGLLRQVKKNFLQLENGMIFYKAGSKQVILRVYQTCCDSRNQPARSNSGS